MSYFIVISHFIARVLFFKCKNAFSVNSRLGRSSRAWSAIYFPKQGRSDFLAQNDSLLNHEHDYLFLLIIILF